MPKLPKSEIIALTKLLSLGDEETTLLVEEQIKGFDSDVLREISIEIPEDKKSLKNRFMNLVSSTKRIELKKEFVDWANSFPQDLEKGILLIAKFYNPLVDIDECIRFIDESSVKLSKSLEEVKLREDSTSVINEVNHFLFMELGFRGNKEDYYDEENSFVDLVIKRKTGSPILLSIIYLLITQRLNLPFSGVNMPAHFVVRYDDDCEPVYIDPFNEGEIVTASMLSDKLKDLNIQWSDSYLLPTTNKKIVSRVILNLISIYQNDSRQDLANYLEEYLNIIKK